MLETTGQTKLSARDRLLVSGARLFAEKGFEGASIRQICKDAGVGINMVHHYFGDKAGLLAAILERFDEQAFSTPLRLLEGAAQSADDMRARTRLVFETILESYIAHRDLALVVLREQPDLKVLQQLQERIVAFLV